MSRHAALEQRIGHQFREPRLLEQALTHRGFSADNNERLEFLGDGVLRCVMCDVLFAQFPKAAEGELTRLVESLVRKETLANVAARLDLGKEMRLGALEGGPTEAMMADVLEAVLGAVFVDAGYAAARKVILQVYGKILETLDPRYIRKDPKSQLNELLLKKFQSVPEYRLLAETRSARNNLFEMECLVPALNLATRGSGSSRQRAQQEAARAMLEKLEK